MPLQQSCRLPTGLPSTRGAHGLRPVRKASPEALACTRLPVRFDPTHRTRLAPIPASLRPLRLDLRLAIRLTHSCPLLPSDRRPAYAAPIVCGSAQETQNAPRLPSHCAGTRPTKTPSASPTPAVAMGSVCVATTAYLVSSICRYASSPPGHPSNSASPPDAPARQVMLPPSIALR